MCGVPGVARISGVASMPGIARIASTAPTTTTPA
jgi:hypothetical protein